MVFYSTAVARYKYNQQTVASNAVLYICLLVRILKFDSMKHTITIRESSARVLGVSSFSRISKVFDRPITRSMWILFDAIRQFLMMSCGSKRVLPFSIFGVFTATSLLANKSCTVISCLLLYHLRCQTYYYYHYTVRIVQLTARH